MKKKKLLFVLLALSLVGCDSKSNTKVLNNTPNQQANDNIALLDESGTMQDTTSIKVHYARNDGDFTNWGIWTWQKLPEAGNGKMIMFDKSDEVYGNYATIDLVNDTRYVGATQIGIICKTHSGADLETWSVGQTDISQDRFIDVPEQAINGVYDVYLYEGVTEIMTSLDQALRDKIISSDFTSKKEISTTLVLSTSVSEITQSMFHVYADGVEVNLKSFKYANKKVTVELADDADIRKTYSIKVDFPSGELKMSVGISCFYNDPDFVNNYTYYGDDLGVTFNKNHTETTFKLWAPISSEVVLNLYDTGTPSLYEDFASKLDYRELVTDYPTRRLKMKKEQQGVWSITVPANLHGRYYTYSVTNGAATNEVVDPYARSCGIDGIRGQVVDFDKINKEIDWGNVVRPNRITDATDASIYEVHVRDATIDETSGVSEKNRGNFLGLAEKNTSYTGKNGKKVSTGLAHIKELGVTHVQLQPVYDYASVDEAQEKKYNWGYDPENYNALEGSYSSNPYDGLTRVREYKQLIKAFAEEGILVNMDVVYNHTAGSADTNFDLIIPGYYHRMNADGTYSNGSACGNEMASERPMYRKFVIDSCKFWTEEYKVSGFRFDLMALLDTTTMEKVYTECQKIYDKVMVYGEPWAGGTSLNTYVQTNQSSIQGLKGVAAFNDHFRNGMRGDNNLSKGWAQGRVFGDGEDNTVVQGIWGQFSGSLTNPLKTVNYVSCHDNYTLFDQINLSSSASATTKIHQVEQAQAMVFMAEGISFIHGGEEMLRTKSNGEGSEIHNSYNAGDAVNKFDYERKTQYLDTFNFMKDVISTRNSFKGFRLTSYSEIEKAMKFNSQNSLMDYEITYGGTTYRVISNNGSSKSVTGLTGYRVECSNTGKTLSGGSLSVGQGEIVVLKK